MSRTDLLLDTPNGLYCPSGDFYVDPRRAVPRAVITHAHSDHARAGHRAVLAHPLTLAVIRKRIDPSVRGEALEYGSNIHINGVTLSLHPAGHVPGSAQVRIEHRGMTAVVTGDYKIETDGLSTPYEQQRCHWFFTECTFGIPAFRWRPQSAVVEQIVRLYQGNRDQGVTTILGAYALGKAQRLLHLLSPHVPDIAVHRTIAAMNGALRKGGLVLPEAMTLTPEALAHQRAERLIIAPSHALRESWVGRIGAFRVHTVSGWMALSSRRGNSNGVALSDHADWAGLMQAVRESGAERIVLDHGYVREFALSLRHEGFPAEIRGGETKPPSSSGREQQMSIPFPS
jgi:putative mRNA 3-end processing factor